MSQKLAIKITFLSGPKKGQILTFKEEDEITIGRDKSSTIVFDGPENEIQLKESQNELAP